MTIHTQPDRKSRTFEVDTKNTKNLVTLDATRDNQTDNGVTFCPVHVIQEGWIELDSKNKPLTKRSS